MPRLILASASQQRQNLLRSAGLDFTVCPSQVHEEHRIRTSCAALVKHNARLKARDVAGRFPDGIVIGADTVVFGGGRRLIGKPRDLPEAEAILTELFTRPHWVYTGVALIDAASGRQLVGHEKTKVYMHSLTKDEIRQYHERTTPLDKAGGFDIEGRGGLFIHRIEGCYSNVIGLPMARLRLMLRELGVGVLQ